MKFITHGKTFEIELDMNKQIATIWYGGEFTEEPFEHYGATPEDEEYEVLAQIEDYLTNQCELEEQAKNYENQ